MKKEPKASRALLAASLALAVTAPGVASAAADDSKNSLVPLRQMVEAIGGTVQWDGATSTVVVKKDAHQFSVKLGESKATLDNGKTLDLPEAAQLINDRTMVPLNLIDDGLDVKAFWDFKSSTVVVDPSDVKTKASLLVASVRKGDFAAFASNLSPALKNAGMKAEHVQQFFAASSAQLGGGAITSATVSNVEENAVHTTVTLNCQFEKLPVPLPLVLRLTKDGLVDDFTFDTAPKLPADQYKLPSYANPASYDEQEVVVGQGDNALPGTLTVPKGDGPFPVVVLVHGSGPNDRDETYYGLKPFRDIADGLASEGIAVLRYEKRTHEHGALFSTNPMATIKEETIDDAFEAVKLLEKTAKIDPKRIYVLGHSQGAYAMPRIIDADKSHEIAGTILMSGPSGSFYDLLEKQFTYLNSLGQFPKDQLDMFKQQFNILRDPNFKYGTTPGLMLPYWWVDLRDYLPAQMAKTQSGKMLVLQGQRDYQVPAENLQGWKDALAGRTDVTYHLYPKLNHFYTEGEGEMSTPMEYTKQQNVPDYVVKDISDFIKN